LEACRLNIILGALASHKFCDLATEEWRTIPWSEHPEQKSAYQHLIDILIEVPALYASSQGSKTTPPTSLLEGLRIWRNQWVLENPNEPHEANPYFPDLNFTWTSVLHFSNLDSANSIILYNATLILILGFLKLRPNPDDQKLPRSPPTAYLPTMSLTPSSFDIEIHNAAIEICRCVDYHLFHIQRGAGSLFLMFPLRVA
jgi:hypothetical protein